MRPLTRISYPLWTRNAAQVCVSLGLVVATAAGCGSESPVAPSPPAQTTPPAPAPAPAPSPPTVTVTAAGFSPIELTITVGSRVTFVNQDSRPHDIAGGADPSRPDCPEIDRAGFLVPGQSRDTGVFETPRTCQYHDHSQPFVPAFEGRIIIR
jgi:plastocyanin